MLSVSVPAHASGPSDVFREVFAGYNGASFVYELYLTDQNGMPVDNPRKMAAGDTLNVEIILTRQQFNETAYKSFGIEFRLQTHGLTYNNDGTTLRNGTPVRLNRYMDGDVVGFAWYDLKQEGEYFPNPVLASCWSYTVEDPKAVNITVPVALIYVTGDSTDYVPVGNAKLFLDLNGGELLGKDVSGEYLSGAVVTLPDAKYDDYIFAGWSDGFKLYPAGGKYVVSGIVTLTAQWEGLERDRYLQLIFNGGILREEDVSGYYAVGETVILPLIEREGYKLVGWSDGVNVYKPGDEYVVYNTVNLTAVWEEVHDYGWVAPVLLGVSALGLGLLLLLLWKRRFVKYSLVNGDIALSYRNGDESVQVSVVLIDGDKEYHLGRSETVMPKAKLNYIKNEMNFAIAPVEVGKYDGKLLIANGETVEVTNCRIKVVDRELDE